MRSEKGDTTMEKFTVILRMPDDMIGDYGTDYFVSHSEADTALEALEGAQACAVAAYPNADTVRDEWAIVAILGGHVAVKMTDAGE